MSNAALLASRYARRPLLLEPNAAREIALRLHGIDDRAFSRPGRLGALLGKLRGARPQPMAMDDEYEPPPPLHERLAYAPLYVGEPEDTGFCWSLSQGVALMQVDTPIAEEGEEFCGVVYHGYDTILAGMREAMADPRVKGLFVRMRSPGGPVSGRLPALAAFMRAARATGNSQGKPIHVYADMACSAAYWVTAQGDWVSAPRVGLVGSIGAVLVLEDWSRAYDKAGVTVNAIQFGAEKTAGADWQALSPTARADFQAEIDQCGRDFIADVCAGRPQLTAEALLETQARVFLASHDESARSGLALGFVDALESEEEAFEALLARIAAPTIALGSVSAPRVAAAPPSVAPKAAKEAAMTDKSRLSSSPAAAPLVAAAARLGRPAPSAQSGAASSPTPSAAEAEGDEPCGTCGGTGKVDGEDCPDCAADDKTTPSEPVEAAPTGDETAAATPAGAEPAAIAASAEAKAHPSMALAAITDGLSLKQFQNQVAASAAAPKGGALREALAQGRRLGPAPAEASQSRGASLVAAARRMGRPQGG
jgi:ClpP class serine protease